MRTARKAAVTASSRFSTNLGFVSSRYSKKRRTLEETRSSETQRVRFLGILGCLNARSSMRLVTRKPRVVNAITMSTSYAMRIPLLLRYLWRLTISKTVT